jgi:hypothetical protein
LGRGNRIEEEVEIPASVGGALILAGRRHICLNCKTSTDALVDGKLIAFHRYPIERRDGAI